MVLHGCDHFLAGRSWFEAQLRNIECEDLEVIGVRTIIERRTRPHIAELAAAVCALLGALRFGQHRVGRKTLAQRERPGRNVVDDPVDKGLGFGRVRILDEQHEGLRLLGCSVPGERGRGIVPVSRMSDRDASLALKAGRADLERRLAIELGDRQIVHHWLGHRIGRIGSLRGCFFRVALSCIGNAIDDAVVVVRDQ